MRKVDLKECPELMKLAEEGEDINSLMALSPETILIRWVNYHLKKQGQTRTINNLGSDLRDSFALTYVLHNLDDRCSLENLSEQDPVKKADRVIKNAELIGVPPLIRPNDLLSGNVKLNTVFVAEIFNTKHGLEELSQEEKEKYDSATMMNDDVEGSRDERAFRFWINSLNIEDLYINNLYDDVRDSLVLLKVIAKLDPTIVDWKKVEKKVDNKYKMGINGNYLVDCCKRLGLKIPGIGGQDFVEGNRKNIIAVVWQLVRLQYLKIIGTLTEEDLVKWANSQVSDIKIKNLKDATLSSGQFLIKLCSAIEPRAINWEIVQPGNTDEEKENNAKYIVSIARKLGAIIFCVWEDIVKVNYKMILVLICTLYEIQNEMKNKSE